MALLSALAPFAGAIGSVAGGLLGYQGQREANKMNIQLGREQMGFQERMSGTSYQRAVADMQQAGLNPMLAYQQGGASSPEGALPQVTNAPGAGVAAAMQAASVIAGVEKMRAETQNVRADTQVKMEGQLPELMQRVLTGRASAREMHERADVLQQEFRMMEHKISMYKFRAVGESFKAESAEYEKFHWMARFQDDFPDIKHKVLEAKLLGLKVPEAIVEAAFWREPEARSVPFYRHAPKSIVGGAFGTAGAVGQDLRRLIQDAVKEIYR